MNHKMAELKCPLCQTSLSENASNMLNAIRGYNDAAVTLANAANFTSTVVHFDSE